MPDLDDQLYRLTTGSKTYVHPVFTIDPDYCEITYQYSATNLSAGDSAITDPSSIDRTFTFLYTKADDAPINPSQTQVVTITATSGTET